MRQRGNILFLILLAVVLFAALAAAVTGSMRGSGKDSSTENTKMLAAKFVEQLTTVTNEYNRWLFTGGYTNPNQIDLNTPNSGGSYGNMTGCTTDPCNFVKMTGITTDISMEKYIAPSCYAYDSSKTEFAPNIYIYNAKAMGTSANELVFYYACVKKAICDEINYSLGLLNPGDAPITAALGSYGTDYAGWQSAATITTPVTQDYFGSGDSRTVGQYTFCSKANNNALYGYVWHVLYVQ